MAKIQARVKTAFPSNEDCSHFGVKDTVKPLTSAIAPLEEGSDWFHRLHGGKEDLIKVILTP